MDKFEAVIDLIKSDTKNQSDDDDLINDVQDENSLYGKQYDRRNGLYSDLLEKYISVYSNKAKNNSVYKLIFFIATLLIFIGIIIASFAALFIAVGKDNGITSAAAILGSLTSIISSIIILPKIIAEHLFPTNEDINMIDMVKNMQLNDSNIRSSAKNTKGSEENLNL